MESGNYGKVNFYNVNEDNYPSRLIVGSDYWMYFNGLSCLFIRTADILSICEQKEMTRAHYNASSRRRKPAMSIGVSLVITYEENSVSANQRENGERG